MIRTFGAVTGIDNKGLDDGGNPTLNGSAIDSKVLNNETYYNIDAKTRRTGTMPVNSGDVAAVSYHRSGTSLHIIPATGYTDGVDDATVITDADFVDTNFPTTVNMFGLQGAMPDNGAVAYNPSNVDVNIANGKHASSKVNGNANYVAANLRRGITFWAGKNDGTAYGIGDNITVTSLHGGGNLLQLTPPPLTYLSSYTQTFSIVYSKYGTYAFVSAYNGTQYNVYVYNRTTGAILQTFTNVYYTLLCVHYDEVSANAYLYYLSNGSPGSTMVMTIRVSDWSNQANVTVNSTNGADGCWRAQGAVDYVNNCVYIARSYQPSSQYFVNKHASLGASTYAWTDIAIGDYRWYNGMMADPSCKGFFVDSGGTYLYTVGSYYSSPNTTVTLYKITTSTGAVTTYSPTAENCGTSGMSMTPANVDSNGLIWIHCGNGIIYKINPSSMTLSQRLASGSKLGGSNCWGYWDSANSCYWYHDDGNGRIYQADVNFNNLNMGFTSLGSLGTLASPCSALFVTGEQLCKLGYPWSLICKSVKISS